MSGPDAPRPTELEVLRDPAQVALLMDPSRRELVSALLERPDSATGLARRLGESRQRLNYHLRVLESAGLIELQEERARRGVSERVMRVVARRFVIDPGSLGDLGGDLAGAGDGFSATYLVALAARTIREVAALEAEAETAGKRLPTASVSTSVRLSDPSEFNAMVEELTRAVGEVVSRYHTEGGGGRTFTVVAGTYPAPRGEAATREDA